MNWFTWQQHRKQILVMGICLAVFAAIVVPTDLVLTHVVHQALTACNSANAAADCMENHISQTNIVVFYVTHMIVEYALLALPFLLGLFWGVPLVASEYIAGTNKLIWTRSVSRRKWLTIKLAWVLVATVVIVGGFAALATWWSNLTNTLYLANPGDLGLTALNRFGSLMFSSQGIVPVAYTIFAVALGIAIGTWCKQLMKGLAIALAVLAVIQFAVPTLIRSHYMSPKTANIAINVQNFSITTPVLPSNMSEAWVLSGHIVSKSDQPITWGNPPQQCAQALTSSSDRGIECLSSIGYHWAIKYQSANRYWDFQWIETGLYLLLSIVPISFTYRLVLKRDA